MAKSKKKKAHSSKKSEPAKKRFPKYLYAVIALAVIACVLLIVLLGGKKGSDEPSPERYAVIDIRDYGTVTIELHPEAAPITVENFIGLAKSGFYDGLTFHRIMEGFMMQGGDPEGTGFGGSEVKIKGEFSANGVNNPLSHTRGAVSMARSGLSMDSASSQFFIVHADSQFLDGQYAAFGYVIDGMDVVDAVCKAAQPTDDNGTIPAAQQPVMTSVKLYVEKP